MPLHESGEDYLEAILVLHEQKGNVRSIDVAQHLGYSKPSVSRAMSIPALQRVYHHGTGRPHPAYRGGKDGGGVGVRAPPLP